MPQQPMLAVQGEAVLEVDPEIARIDVSVAAVDRDRAKTLKLLNDRAVAVDKVLASFPDLIEKTETSGVRDAVRRARDYAEALGSDLTGLVELADARLLSDSRGQTEAQVMSPARLPHRVRAAAPEEFSFDLVPAKQVVRATVEARFTIGEPDLAAVDIG
jgi:uncharacterized protein YggE